LSGGSGVGHLLVSSDVSSFAIAGNGDIIALEALPGSSGTLWDIQLDGANGVGHLLTSGVASFALAGDSDVIALGRPGWLYDIHLSGGTGVGHLLDSSGVSSFAVAGNVGSVALGGCPGGSGVL